MLDDSKWFLLEQSVPDLCADRIDYTLREVHRYFDVALEEIHAFISQLVVNEGKVCLRDLHSGEWFVRQYRKIVIDFFYDPLNVFSHEIVGKVLSYAIEAGEITLFDLMQTDTEVWEKIQAISDPEIVDFLTLLTTPIIFERVDENGPYDGFQRKKVRYVDPLVLNQERYVRVSECSVEAKRIIEATLVDGNKGIYFKYRNN
ncbi:hypothetical protein [Candidatus Enterococcus clewellii]|uniref:Uncharacterized protein n=1 Tax=Candidatus Enterococcus clewellii TaxID=1834193 RepID=A0A242KBN6_9ENTE|nr:hypothetical protein [Enterococcus sp. 9E7_DIV0242]OTP18583.1 hypothetical protein A5888_000397 [Enterococcus sp. 9E7_DIV0242]